MTARGSLKWNIAGEARDLASDLPEYPDIERRFKEYKLEWMSEKPVIYYPVMVREFYVNYDALLYQWPKVPEVEMKRLHKVSVREVMVEISQTTTNRFLFGPNYVPPPWISEFDHQMRDQFQQRPWFVHDMT